MEGMGSKLFLELCRNIFFCQGRIRGKVFFFIFFIIIDETNININIFILFREIFFKNIFSCQGRPKEGGKHLIFFIIRDRTF